MPVGVPAIYDAAVFSFFPLHPSIVCGFLASCGSSLSLLRVWESVLWPGEGGAGLRLGGGVPLQRTQIKTTTLSPSAPPFLFSS